MRPGERNGRHYLLSELELVELLAANSSPTVERLVADLRFMRDRMGRERLLEMMVRGAEVERGN